MGSDLARPGARDQKLDGEMERSPKLTLYRCLRPTLLGQETGPLYSEVAASLGLTEGAVKMVASRLRGRYAYQLLRDEIGRTVADPAEVDEEIAAASWRRSGA